MAYRNIEDSRAAIRDHYRRNKQSYLDRNQRRRKKIAKFIRDLKSTMECSRCGFNENPRALDFHHRDGKKKDQILSAVSLRGWGEKRILAEIAKCDILCANCHRIEHDKPS